MIVKGKKITVLGAARSGIAAAIMLAKKGAQVFVSDAGDPSKLTEKLNKLAAHNIEYEAGQHSEKIYDADMIVLSPGIAVASDIVQSCIKKAIKVYSEIEAASWFNNSPVIAVTGSNGKTTTTTLIGEMLHQNDKDAIVAGNIGQAFSEFVENSAKDRWAVVELSSFQLETIDSFKPDVAVVLNFAPNHLDRYASYDDYLKAKWRITKNLNADDLLVYNADDQKLSDWAANLDVKKLSFKVGTENPDGAAYHNDAIWLFSEKILDTDKIILSGIHNYMNIMAACLAVYKTGVSYEVMRNVLQQFKGVEHRLELVRVVNGVRYINDSKATTVESLFYALQSYKDPIVLIAGGKDKGSDFTRLNDLIITNVKHLVLIGVAADKMEKAWHNLKPLSKAGSLQEAVLTAQKTADENDVVLLSPACASFDMFSDYEDRGRQFKNIVNALEK